MIRHSAYHYIYQYIILPVRTLSAWKKCEDYTVTRKHKNECARMFQKSAHVTYDYTKLCARDKTRTTICYAPTSDLDNLGPYLGLKLREMGKN